MGFTVLSPVGAVAEHGKRPLKVVDRLEGKSVGFLWGMHGNSQRFWPVFEVEVEGRYRPSGTYRHHKLPADGKFMGNTWIPAPAEVIAEASGQVDYVLCGVGA